MAAGGAILRWVFAAAVIVLLAAPNSRADRREGELRARVRDPSGRPVSARVALRSRVSQFETSAVADSSGIARFKRLPFGVYRVEVRFAGFETLSRRLEIRSEVPVSLAVTLAIEKLESSITVEAGAPLLDAGESSIILPIGRARLEHQPFSPLGRGMIELVHELPGWLLEANAVLHPRGSEYDTQYVIDGIPLYDNRSINVVAPFDVDEFESADVMTAGFPAEYGRRLGGVIELHTRREERRGHHPEFVIQRGSFETTSGSFVDSIRGENTSFSFALRGGHTRRYLDPPSLENFTNKASSSGGNARFERDLGESDRLSLYARSNRVQFLVPGDRVQQAAGQRQDRRGTETALLAHYQRVFSPRMLGSARGMLRDTGAELWSNPLSTPVAVGQDRGLRQGTLSGALVAEGERHTLKFGGDVRRTRIRETFSFARRNDPAETAFRFRENAISTDAGLYVQDRVRLGRFVMNAGLRFDHYRLLGKTSALSPRISAAYYWPRADLLLRASYDRVFQTPPLENLLLSSLLSPNDLDEVEVVLPIPASRAHFFEAGIRKSFLNRFRLDITHYWRRFENFFDDDVFFNTGISFPVTFDRAEVEGTEVRFELPNYKTLTAFLSYSNMRGISTSPITGGLFLEGGEVAELREQAVRFPITQDQRNTVASMIRFEPHSRIWTALRGRYGSGLPVELEDLDGDGDRERGSELDAIPSEILERVNFERGRVRPNFSFDLSVGAELWRDEGRVLRLQVDVVNVANRLKVINFSGVFSGTALAPSRMIGVKLRVRL